MKWEELSPEQREQLQQTMIGASKAIIDAFEAVFAAMQPSIKILSDFYSSLPQDIKEKLAAMQVEDKLKRDNIDALKTIDPKKAWIAERLDYYSRYWNPEKKIFEIETGHEDPENNWTPTRDELLADLEKSWEFEHES